jgi:hypothetical protein
MIINVYDSRYPITKPFGVYRPGDHVVDYHLAPGAKIAVIPTFIIAVAEGEKSIWLLRLCAHGNSGFLQLGDGLTAENAFYFNILRNYFSPGARGIELHACGVASTTPLTAPHITGRGGTGSPSGPGYALLRALAQGTGVPVTAAINIEEADRNYNWEGMTMTVTPSGTSCMGCGSFSEINK